MRTPAWIWITVAMVFAAAMAAVAWLVSPREMHIDAGDTKRVARGERIYAQYCAACHGARLEGQADWKTRNPRGRLPAPPHDETGHTWHHDNQVLFEITKFGLARHAPPGYQSDMPAFEGTLDDKDIVDVLAFIKSRWPPLIHDKRREAGMN